MLHSGHKPPTNSQQEIQLFMHLVLTISQPSIITPKPYTATGGDLTFTL